MSEFPVSKPVRRRDAASASARSGERYWFSARTRRRSNETPHNTPVCIVPWNEPNRPVQPRAEGEVDSRSRPVKPTLRVILVRPSLSPTRHARPVKLHGVVINDFNPRSRISMYLVVTTSSYSTDVAQSLSVCWRHRALIFSVRINKTQYFKYVYFIKNKNTNYVTINSKI